MPMTSESGEAAAQHLVIMLAMYCRWLYAFRYERKAPEQGGSLDCALFGIGYAAALLRKTPMNLIQADMGGADVQP